MSTRPYIPEINLLRGWGALAVVGIHVMSHLQSMEGLGPLAGFGPLVGFWWVGVMCAIRFAVPLFFVISGFSLYGSYKPTEGATEFYRRRFRRVLPPYLFFSLIYLTARALFAEIRGGDLPHAQTVVVSLFGGTACYHLWFFRILFELYLIFPLLAMILLRSHRLRTDVLLCVAVWAVQWGWRYAAGVWMPTHGGRDFTTWLFFCSWGWFVTGMVIRRHYPVWQAGLTRCRAMWFVAGCAVVALSAVALRTALLLRYESLYAFPPEWRFVESSVETLYSCVMILTLWKWCAGGKPRPWLAAVGTTSFGIYLIHPLFQIYLIDPALRRMGITGSGYFIVAYGLVVAASFVTVWTYGKLRARWKNRLARPA